MNPQLADLLDFTQHDLNANRSGRLTDRQRAHLQTQRDAYSALYSTGLGLLIGLAVVCIALTQTAAKFYVELLFVVPAAFILAYIIQLWINFTLDLRARRVDTVSGCAQSQPILRFQTWLYVGSLRFGLSHRVARAFQNGAAYRVYYARRSKTILSVEAV